MTKLLTPNFKTWMARQFVKSVVGRERSVLSESISRYVEYKYVDPEYTDEFFVIIDNDQIEVADIGYFYVFAGVEPDWTTAIPTPTEAIDDYHYGTYDTMLFGKHATTTDVSYMVARHDWISDTVYSEYNSYDPLLPSKNFFVVTLESNEYHVFKCIDNAGGSPSTVMPSAFQTDSFGNQVSIQANEYYQTSDGYIWMYLYSIPNITFKKFATPDFIPLTLEVTEVPPPIGSIEAINVTDPGIYHTIYNTGSVKRSSVNGINTNFYLNTDGNDFFSIPNIYAGSAIYITSGTGNGQLRKIVSSRIDGPERLIVVDSPFDITLDGTSRFEIAPGVTVVGDGTNATARAIVDTATTRLSGIDIVSPGKNYSYANVSITTVTGYFDEAGVFVNTDTVATAEAIISPPRGHGRDLVNELYADKVCVSVDFIESEHPITGYAQYGLIVDPLFKSMTIDVDAPEGFSAGEVVVQQDTAAYGVLESVDEVNKTLSLKNVRGVFTSNSTIYGVGSNTYSTSTAVSSDNNSFTIDQIVDNSGEILLIKNDLHVNRAADQSERIKMIIDF